MKKHLLSLSLIFISLMNLSAQDVTKLIGVFNKNQVLENLEDYKKESYSLIEKERLMNKEIKQLKDQIELETKFIMDNLNTISPREMDAKKENLQMLESKMIPMMRNFSSDLEKLKSEINQRFNTELQAYLQKFALRNNYILILDDSKVDFYIDAINITNQLINQIKNK